MHKTGADTGRWPGSTRSPDVVPDAAQRQGGAFTRPQALDAGWSYFQIQNRLRSGAWTVLPGGPIIAATEPVTALTLAWSAHLAMPDAVLSHLTAGALMRFPVTVADVTHVITQRRRGRPGIVCHRAPLLPDETSRYAGLPVTSRARTAIDCLALLSEDEAVRLWAWLSTREILDRSQLAAAVRSRFGQAGNATLIKVLMAARGGALSVAEQRVHRLLRSAHVTGWTANVKIVDGSGVIIAVADIFFAAERLILEVDGFAAHSGREAFVADRRRQNALVNAGFRVLRVTWDDIVDQPVALITDVRRALRR